MSHSSPLFTADQLAQATTRVADDVASVLGDQRPLLVGVLKGALVFLADLVRAAGFPLDVDFLALSPFGRGRVRIEQDLIQDVDRRHVVVVEDIVDTGLTLSYLLRTLMARGAASVHVATLLDRPVRRLVEIPVRWKGFDLDDRFVVGYGMDFAGRYRNLPEVRVVDDLAALAADPDLLMPEVFPGQR